MTDDFEANVARLYEASLKLTVDAGHGILCRRCKAEGFTEDIDAQDACQAFHIAGWRHDTVGERTVCPECATSLGLTP